MSTLQIIGKFETRDSVESASSSGYTSHVVGDVATVDHQTARQSTSYGQVTFLRITRY